MGNIKPSPLFGPAFSQMANLKGSQFYILASGANERAGALLSLVFFFLKSLAYSTE